MQTMLLSAHEVLYGQKFAGVIEELLSGLAAHFRYLAQVLDHCGRRCPKTDHFVQQLQLSDTGVSGGIAPKRNVKSMGTKMMTQHFCPCT